MMSERKRKQKFSLNPRGKNWSESSNKFGQKLMEKMGWSTGKGLGANEDGMTEHIRVAYKNDTQGMGFKKRDDQWTEHESNFTELLKTLGGAENGNVAGNELKIESLEKKSETSKARVHYRKFTRGKDLSKYSEKDLANIFGKKSLKELSKPPTTKEEKPDEKENVETKSFGVVTHNGGNMLDYFKKKLPSFKNNVQNTTNNDSESDTDRPSFGLGFADNGKQNEEKQEIKSEFVENKFKNKTNGQLDNFRKQCFGLGYDRYNENETKPKSKFTSFVKATDIEIKEPLKYGISKITKKKEDVQNSNDERPTNITKIQSSFMSFVKGSDQSNDPKDNVNKKRKKNGVDDSISENVQKKKTKKIKISESAIKPTFVSFIQENGTEENENVDETSTDKKKKKKKRKSIKEENADETIDNVKTEEKDDVRNVIVDDSLKKKKKNKKASSEKSNETLDNSNVDDVVPPKKGKKRKSESELDVAFTPMKKKFKNFEDLHTIPDEEKIVATPDKKSKKNKRDKKIKDTNNENGLANPAFDPLYNEITVQKHHLDAIVEEPESFVDKIAEEKTGKGDTSLQSEPEKKKKKKKSKNIEGIDNPCLEELSIIIDESSQSIDNSIPVSETQKKKKTKKSKKEKEHSTIGIENSAFNENSICNGNAEENKYEIKEKKRKNEEGAVVASPTSEDSLNGERKKRKKKTKMNEIAQEIEPSQSEQNVVETPKMKTKRKKELLSVENPCFNSDDSLISLKATPNKYEVQRSKKDKNLGIVNPGLDLTSPPPSNVTLTEDLPIMDDDSLMLNVVCTPIIKKDKGKKLERRKSVRFSDVNQSIFINNTDSPADLRKNGSAGLDNAGYDQFGNRIEESLDTLNKQLDDYQAEVENDLNEAKMQFMVGEVGDPEGENEILPNGEVKLKFKYASFGKMPPWMKIKKGMSPKTSYRHLIKGDIVLAFRNTNMHDIMGYNEHLKATST